MAGKGRLGDGRPRPSPESVQRRHQGQGLRSESVWQPEFNLKRPLQAWAALTGEARPSQIKAGTDWHRPFNLKVAGKGRLGDGRPRPSPESVQRRHQGQGLRSESVWQPEFNLKRPLQARAALTGEARPSQIKAGTAGYPGRLRCIGPAGYPGRLRCQDWRRRLRLAPGPAF